MSEFSDKSNEDSLEGVGQPIRGTQFGEKSGSLGEREKT